MRVWWRYHKVQPGDTLGSIARTYRSTPKAIAEANNLDDEELAPDSKLIIPIAPGKNTDTGAYARATTRYKSARAIRLSRLPTISGFPRRWCAAGTI